MRGPWSRAKAAPLQTPSNSCAGSDYLPLVFRPDEQELVPTVSTIGQTARRKAGSRSAQSASSPQADQMPAP
jgi:hypothetical protein